MLKLCLQAVCMDSKVFCSMGNHFVLIWAAPRDSGTCVAQMEPTIEHPDKCEACWMRCWSGYSFCEYRISIFDIRYSIFDIRYSKFEVRSSKFDVRSSMFGTRCSIPETCKRTIADRLNFSARFSRGGAERFIRSCDSKCMPRRTAAVHNIP